MISVDNLMDIRLKKSEIKTNAAIAISGSKSETNRLLLLQALFPSIVLENASESDDSIAMRIALQAQSGLVDIGHAGTAMRFLTAFFAVGERKTVTLTGSGRMKNRPISILVNALRQLGADIDYLENEGFPPLKITGKKITGKKITLKADVSSQYISALLLIAPKLENGLELTLEGEITSRPYIEMTLELLRKLGVQTTFDGSRITVSARSEIRDLNFKIESDWSSASYFYSIAALSEIGTQIRLSAFKKDSLQGDSALVEIYKNFGVETVFADDWIALTKIQNPGIAAIDIHLNKTPDLAQTIAVTCFGLGIGCTLSGLHTLKIKETDRLVALQNELEKLGATISVTDDRLQLQPSGKINSGISIETYDDHRMAMAFAPMALKVPIGIRNAEVVSKSYPDFWSDLRHIGFDSETE